MRARARALTAPALPRSFLDHWDTRTPSKHPVFGQVTDGMDVVSGISTTATRSDRPVQPIRVNTIRVVTYSSMSTLKFRGVLPDEKDLSKAPAASETRDCHFVGHDGPMKTGFYDLANLDFGAVVEAPAVVISPSTTYLVEPGWKLRIGRYGAGLFEKAQ